MAGVYRLKTCPICGVEHRKRGLYCSASHARKSRVTTEETKEKLRITHTERLADKTSETYLAAVDNLRAATAASHGVDNGSTIIGKSLMGTIGSRMAIDRSLQATIGKIYLLFI
jgi:adenylyl- and sulfurtransferase ThiI